MNWSESLLLSLSAAGLAAAFLTGMYLRGR